jgi:hypothetical protein
MKTFAFTPAFSNISYKLSSNIFSQSGNDRPDPEPTYEHLWISTRGFSILFDITLTILKKG